MRLSKFLLLLCTLLYTIPTLWTQSAPPFYLLEDVRPGLRGVGRTVFEGHKVEEFQVEVLGVLKNAIAPKHDVILARLSGGALEKTGVIAGMSGSPVYIEGKLVGAVALAFPFAKEPLAGITPIQEMLDVVPESMPLGPSRPRSPSVPPVGDRQASLGLSFHLARVSSGSADSIRLIPASSFEAEEPGPLWSFSRPLASLGGEPADPTAFTSLRLPLRFGGFSSAVINPYKTFFHSLGLEPMLGGSLAGTMASATLPAGPPGTGSIAPGLADIVPGSMISLLLVRGDLDLNIDCTVTYRRANDLYACGHRVMLAGPTDIPFAPAWVLTSVPSLASSFKIDAPGSPVGAIHQDRFSAIYGKVGDQATLIPVHLQVESTLNKKQDYRFEVVHETLLTPLLVNLGVASTLAATERMVGPSTLSIQGKIRLQNGGSVEVDDIVSGDANNPAGAAASVATPLAYLLDSPFRDSRISGIELSIVSQNERRIAELEQVWSTKSEVSPGDRIEVTALLRGPVGETLIQKIPVEIPESLADKTLSVVVGSGASLNALQFRFSPQGGTARDLDQLVRALNRMRRNNRLYALLMAPQRSFILQGDEYPSPPPSLVQTFLADPAVASSVVSNGTSVVGDFETKTTSYAIRGQKTLFLKVASKF